MIQSFPQTWSQYIEELSLTSSSFGSFLFVWDEKFSRGWKEVWENNLDLEEVECDLFQCTSNRLWTELDSFVSVDFYLKIIYQLKRAFWRRRKSKSWLWKTGKQCDIFWSTVTFFFTSFHSNLCFEMMFRWNSKR